eukprot:SAG25_NODE_103_length_15482_cov_9.187415_10_plen_76_part_00
MCSSNEIPRFTPNVILASITLGGGGLVNVTESPYGVTRKGQHRVSIATAARRSPCSVDTAVTRGYVLVLPLVYTG